MKTFMILSKKKMYRSLFAVIMCIGITFTLINMKESKRVFNITLLANIEALATGEYEGRCALVSTNYCFVACPRCGAKHYVDGYILGLAQNVSGTCDKCGASL